MKKDSTLIGMIVDKSGSMAGLVTDTIGGYNTFVEEQRKLPGQARIIRTLFDNNVQIGEIEDLATCTLMNSVNYIPNGYTALYDAIGMTINHIGNYLKGMSEDNRPDKVIICIITDGAENTSKEFKSKDKIKEMITHQQDVYKWEFIFSGANIDAFDVGGSMGIHAQNTVQYAATSDGTRSVYGLMSKSVSQLRQ